MKEGIHFAKELEHAIIGVCLLEPEAFGRIYGTLEEKHFYVEDGAKTFSVLKDMFQNSLPIDLMTVWERMIAKQVDLSWFKKFGSGDPSKDMTAFLMNCTNAVTSSSNLEYWAHIIREMWKRREIEKITRSGIDETGDPTKQGYQINERINEILGGEVKQDWYDLNDLYWNLLIHQNDIKSGKKQLVTTGFKAIDRMNGGFSPGQLIVIGARPSVGKSALMNKIAFAVAKQEKAVGIISLEMNNTEIAARLASIQSETSFGIIYRNLFNDEQDHQIFYDRISKNSQLPIYVSDKTKVDVNEIKAKAIKLKHRKGLSCLILDYLQLVETATSKNYNREQEVARISRGLKLIAMELEIPVIVLCQLNRASTNRKGKDRYPMLSDLRESGAIEQDADVVMMLHRDWMAGYEANPETGASTEFEADLLGVKWRNGAQFHLGLDFQPELMKFSERHGVNFIPVHIPKDEEQDYF
jgi:replicative DNA helicase